MLELPLQNMWVTTGLTAFGVVKDMAGASLPRMLLRLVGIVLSIAMPYTLVSQKHKVIAAKPFLTTKGGETEETFTR